MKQFLFLFFLSPALVYSQTKKDQLFKASEKKFFDSLVNEHQFSKVYSDAYEVKNSMNLAAGSRAVCFVTPKKFTSRMEFEQYANGAKELFKRLTKAYTDAVLVPAYTGAHANYYILSDQYMAAVCL